MICIAENTQLRKEKQQRWFILTAVFRIFINKFDRKHITTEQIQLLLHINNN